MATIKKAELHVHLEGTISPTLAKKLAARNKLTLRPGLIAADERSYAYDGFMNFLKAYDEVADVIRKPEDYYDITFDYLASNARDLLIVHKLSLERLFSFVEHNRHGAPPSAASSRHRCLTWFTTCLVASLICLHRGTSLGGNLEMSGPSPALCLRRPPFSRLRVASSIFVTGCTLAAATTRASASWLPAREGSATKSPTIITGARREEVFELTRHALPFVGIGWRVALAGNVRPLLGIRPVKLSPGRGLD